MPRYLGRWLIPARHGTEAARLARRGRGRGCHEVDLARPRDALRFRRLARRLCGLGPRPSPTREQIERDGPRPVCTRQRLAELEAILERSVARRRAEQER